MREYCFGVLLDYTFETDKLGAMKLSGLMLSISAFTATINAAVLQKCTTGYDDATIVLGVDRNTSVISYVLGEAQKSLGIKPWRINDESLADGSCGLKLCSEQLYSEGQCHGKEIGDMFFTRGTEDTPIFYTMQLIGHNSTWFGFYGVVRCVVLYREGDDEFIDVTFQEHHGESGVNSFYKKEETILHWYFVMLPMLFYAVIQLVFLEVRSPRKHDWDNDGAHRIGKDNREIYLLFHAAYALYGFLKHGCFYGRVDDEVTRNSREILKLDFEKLFDVLFQGAMFGFALLMIGGKHRAYAFLDHFKFKGNLYVSLVLYLCLLNSLVYIFDPLIQMFCGYTGYYVRPPLNTIVWVMQSFVWIPGTVYVAYQGSERLKELSHCPVKHRFMKRCIKLVCVTLFSMYTISYLGQLVEELRWDGNFFVYFANPLFRALRLDELPIDKSLTWWAAVFRQLPKTAPLVIFCPLIDYWERLKQDEFDQDCNLCTKAQKDQFITELIEPRGIFEGFTRERVEQFVVDAERRSGMVTPLVPY